MGMPLKIQEKYKTLNRVFQGKNSPLSLSNQNTRCTNWRKTIKSCKGKEQAMHKIRSIGIIAVFLMETLKARIDVLQTLKITDASPTPIPSNTSNNNRCKKIRHSMIKNQI